MQPTEVPVPAAVDALTDTTKGLTGDRLTCRGVLVTNTFGDTSVKSWALYCITLTPSGEETEKEKRRTVRQL